MEDKKPIVVLCPMDCECDVLKSGLSEKKETTFGGYEFSSGKYNGYPVIIVRCLIGVVNSAVCAALAAEKFNPLCVIVQGTAGAHDKNLRKYDIVIANSVVGLSNAVSPSKKEGEGTDPLSWEHYGTQTYIKKTGKTEFLKRFYCDEKLVAAAKRVCYESGRVFEGTVGASDLWNKEADLILHFNKNFGTLCEAMEGYGVAQVCAGYGLPMIEVRVISNNELAENENFSEDTAGYIQQFTFGLLKEISEDV